MPRKSNTRAAQGSGTIRKKTVTRKGQPYTLGGPRHRGPGPRHWEADPAQLFRKDAEGSPGEDAGRRRGCQRGDLYGAVKDDPGAMAGRVGKGLSWQRQTLHGPGLLRPDQEPHQARPGSCKAGRAEHPHHTELLQLTGSRSERKARTIPQDCEEHPRRAP